MRTENPNGFTGSITVRDNGVFSGWTRNAGSPFGSATGAVNLYGGYLELQNGDANDLSVTKGNVTISGPGGIWVSDSKLTINSILRPDHGVFTVQGEQASGTYLGNGATNGDYLFVTNAPAVTATNGGNGMVAPWMVEYLGRYFLSYSSANGFVPATFTVTGAATGGGTFTSTATDVVNLPSGGTVATGGQSAYAVRLGGDPSTTTTYTLNSNAPGDVLTIVSGGLILASDCGQNYNPAVNTANINFGSSANPVEGVIYIGNPPTGATRVETLSGTLQSWGGLTVSSFIAGNHNAMLNITGANPGISGQITIDNAYVNVGANNSLGPSTNPIYLNNVPGSNNMNAPQGGLGAYNGGITIANPITLGPLGGELDTTWYGQSFTVSGQITGSGMLYVAGFHDAWITLSNTSTTAPNNWTGGTWVTGTHLGVNSGVVLGSGPIIIGGCGSDGGSSLYLYGTGNVASNNQVILEDTDESSTVGLYVYCAGRPSARWRATAPSSSASTATATTALSR